MKEVSAVFQDGFKVGLTPDLTLNTQAEYLAQSYNMVPGQFGIEPRKEVKLSPPFMVEGAKWPFPYFFTLSRLNLLVWANHIDVVANLTDTTPSYSFSGSFTKPHIADFIDFLVFASNTSAPNIALYHKNGVVSKGWDEENWPHFRTCCNFKGQLIIGDLWNLYGPDQSSCSGNNNPKGVKIEGENLVAWSKIGSMEWTFSLGNEVGWAPMPWQGKVLALLPLLNEIVVYGSNGIAKLAPSKDPVATFGVGDFGDIGLLNRDCVAGDFAKHLFLGTDYNLYLVEPERPLSGEGKAPKRIGYSHWMKNLVNPIITYDPGFGQWWIGDNKRCYIFTGEALGEANITPTHLNRLGGELLGYYLKHGDEKVIIETSPLSLNSKGIKTLMNVEVDVQTEEGQTVWGWVSWLSDYMKKFKKGRRIKLDPRGSFFPITAGTEFKVALEGPSYKNFTLSKMWLHFKNTDKTFARGVINAGRPAE